VPKGHGGSGDGECGKETQWMGTPSEIDVASEVAEEGAHGAGSAACIVTGRDAHGGGDDDGCDDLPMRNSRIRASSLWIPAMAAP
jgi:hypothetical protein